MNIKSLLTNSVKATVSNEHTLLTGESLLSYGGTFAGESITLEILEQGSWEPVEDGVFTSAGQKILKLAQGVKIRATISNGAGTPALNLSIMPRF